MRTDLFTMRSVIALDRGVNKLTGGLFLRQNGSLRKGRLLMNIDLGRVDFLCIQLMGASHDFPHPTLLNNIDGASTKTIRILVFF